MQWPGAELVPERNWRWGGRRGLSTALIVLETADMHVKGGAGCERFPGFQALFEGGGHWCSLGQTGLFLVI